MKCFYCVQEYRTKKRLLNQIKEISLIDDGTGFCFSHLSHHQRKHQFAGLQDYLSGRAQAGFAAMEAPRVMSTALEIGLFGNWGRW